MCLSVPVSLTSVIFCLLLCRHVPFSLVKTVHAKNFLFFTWPCEEDYSTVVRWDLVSHLYVDLGFYCPHLFIYKSGFSFSCFNTSESHPLLFCVDLFVHSVVSIKYFLDELILFYRMKICVLVILSFLLANTLVAFVFTFNFWFFIVSVFCVVKYYHPWWYICIVLCRCLFSSFPIKRVHLGPLDSYKHMGTYKSETQNTISTHYFITVINEMPIKSLSRVYYYYFLSNPPCIWISNWMPIDLDSNWIELL